MARVYSACRANQS